MKSILLACSLFAVASLPVATSAAGASVQPTKGPADTLITLTESQLAEAVQRVAQARLASEGYSFSASGQELSLQQSLTPETLRLVKLQMLLQALGLTPGLAPATVGTAVSSPSYPAYAPAQAIAPVRDARVDRLEHLLTLLVQQRQAEHQALLLPGRSSLAAPQPAQQAALQTSDSLLRILQQELTALRMQPAPAAQPQVIYQPVPQAPLQQPLAPEVRTEVRTDTIVSAVGFKRQVFFAVGQSKLLPEARLTLNEAYRFLAADPSLQLVLTGYASPEGNAKRNEQLSAQRSQAVLDYLIACGISPDRLHVVQGGIDHQADLRGVARRVDLELR